MRANTALIFCLFLSISLVSASLPCEESEIQYKCGESPYSTDYEGSFNLQKYCTKNGISFVEIINCSNGCIDGACINESLILCEDTDGGNNCCRNVLHRTKRDYWKLQHRKKIY